MILQEHLEVIGCAVALQQGEKAIAFARHPSLPLFVDMRKDVQAVWSKEGLTLKYLEGELDKSTLFSYNTWHRLDNLESPFARYIKDILSSDRGLYRSQFGYTQ